MAAFGDADAPLQKASDILSALDEMRKTEDLCDFTIRAEQESYHVHRNILMANSEYFKGMFAHSLQENVVGSVDLKTVTSTAIRECIAFMYCSRVKITTENALEILQASHMLQLKGLTDACFKVLKDTLTVDNCLAARSISHIYGSKDLEVASIEFIARNFGEIARDEDFSAITCEEAIRCVKFAQTQSFHDAWDIVKTWTEYDLPKRKSHFPTLFEVLNLEKCSFNFLWNNVYQETLVKESAVYGRAEQALIYKVAKGEESVNIQNWEMLRTLTSVQGGNSHAARSRVFEFIRANLGEIPEKATFKSFTIDEIGLCIPETMYLTAQNATKLQGPGLLVMQVWHAIMGWIKSGNASRQLQTELLIKMFLASLHLGVAQKNVHPIFQCMMDESLVRWNEKCKQAVAEKIAQFLIDGHRLLNTSNCLKYKLAMDDNKQSGLSARASEIIADFIRTNYSQILSSEEFLGLDKENVVKILPSLKNYTGIYAWKAIQNWRRHDQMKRNLEWEDLLQQVMLDCFSSVYLRKNILPYCLNRASMYQLVTEAATTRDRKGKRDYVVFENKKMQTLVGYSPLWNDWALFQDVPFSNEENTTFLFTIKGRRIYILQNYQLSRLNKVDQQSESWTELTRIPLNLSSSAQAAVLGDEIHIIDGKITLYFDTDKYCKETSKWRRYERLEEDRVRLDQTLVADEDNDCLYSVGGWQEDFGATNMVDRYYEPENEWTEISDMLKNRIKPAACVLNGNIYVFGGKDDDGVFIDHAEFYHRGHRNWTKLKDIPCSMRHLCACVMSERIFVFGGEGSNLLVAEYDTTNPRNRWELISEHKVDHQDLAMAGVVRM